MDLNASVYGIVTIQTQLEPQSFRLTLYSCQLGDCASVLNQTSFCKLKVKDFFYQGANYMQKIFVIWISLSYNNFLQGVCYFIIRKHVKNFYQWHLIAWVQQRNIIKMNVIFLLLQTTISKMMAHVRVTKLWDQLHAVSKIIENCNLHQIFERILTRRYTHTRACTHTHIDQHIRTHTCTYLDLYVYYKRINMRKCSIYEIERL